MVATSQDITSWMRQGAAIAVQLGDVEAGQLINAIGTRMSRARDQIEQASHRKKRAYHRRIVNGFTETADGAKIPRIEKDHS